MRVAVIFFGLARGIPLTLDSIQRHVFACNRAAGLSLYAIASLNLIDTITNPRNGEFAVPLTPTDAFLLDAQAYRLVRQDDAAIAPALAAAQTQPDTFGNDWISVRNHLHQLASLQRAWQLAAALGGFDYYLFLRPDLIYRDELRLPDLIARFDGDGCLALPAWHSFGGLNDRFAFAGATAARAYAGRLDLVERYCTRAALHPESLLAHALAEAGCKVCALPVHAQRVRAHGAIKEEDFEESVAALPLTPQRLLLEDGRVQFRAPP
jgi:hypothetical protein